jgi:hypothetical protein
MNQLKKYLIYLQLRESSDDTYPMNELRKNLINFILSLRLSLTVVYYHW